MRAWSLPGFAVFAVFAVGAAPRRDYVQDKVRPLRGREGALGYERYIAKEHMDVRRDYVRFAQQPKNRGEAPLPQIASEHMDKVRPLSGREGALGYVRRDCFSFAQR